MVWQPRVPHQSELGALSGVCGKEMGDGLLCGEDLGVLAEQGEGQWADGGGNAQALPSLGQHSFLRQPHGGNHQQLSRKCGVEEVAGAGERGEEPKGMGKLAGKRAAAGGKGDGSKGGVSEEAPLAVLPHLLLRE